MFSRRTCPSGWIGMLCAMARQTFKIRRFSTGRSEVHRIAVPAEIARALDPDIEYVCELTERGLVYSRADLTPEPELKLPSWAKRRKRT
jgi:hypothetical protein